MLTIIIVLTILAILLVVLGVVIEIITAPHIKAQRERQRAHNASLQRFQEWHMAQKQGTQGGRDYEYADPL